MVSCGTDFLMFHTCSEIRLGTFMLTEKRVEVVTVKVSALFNPKDDQFPHFRLVLLEADRQGYLCLLFYIDKDSFLILESRIKRYEAIRKLELMLENASFPVYEIRNSSK